MLIFEVQFYLTVFLTLLKLEQFWVLILKCNIATKRVAESNIWIDHQQWMILPFGSFINFKVTDSEISKINALNRTK